MLADILKNLLSDTFVIYFKAHSYHWNVEGPDFQQYHEFLGNFYKSVWNNTDIIAELIRTLDVYAPVSLGRVMELKTMEESTDVIPNSSTMIKNLYNDNSTYLAALYNAYDSAEKSSEFGISNKLQDIISEHEKHAWMLRAFTK